MAKKGGSRRSNNERGSDGITSPGLLHDFGPVARSSIRPSALPFQGYRRIWEEAQRQSAWRQLQRLQPKSFKRLYWKRALPQSVIEADFRFRKALVCARRKVRREVLFSMEIGARRGSGSGKPRRVTEESKVRC